MEVYAGRTGDDRHDIKGTDPPSPSSPSPPYHLTNFLFPCSVLMTGAPRNRCAIPTQRYVRRKKELQIRPCKSWTKSNLLLHPLSPSNHVRLRRTLVPLPTQHRLNRYPATQRMGFTLRVVHCQVSPIGTWADLVVIVPIMRGRWRNGWGDLIGLLPGLLRGGLVDLLPILRGWICLLFSK